MFVKYRIRFCCNTCNKWDVISLPYSILENRFKDWKSAITWVRQQQFEQIHVNQVSDARQEKELANFLKSF